MKKRKFAVYLAVALVFAGGLLLWFGSVGDLWPPLFQSRSKGPSAPSSIGTEAMEQSANMEAEEQHLKKTSIPKEIPLLKADQTNAQIPPPPPLPEVPTESTQMDRKEAFGLKNSVDYIVRKDEPFEIAGKKLTIQEIQQRLRREDKEEEILHPIREIEIGASIRKPIVEEKAAQAPLYYAVRVVLPGENLWNIHFAVIQNYLARRQIFLASDSDEPNPDGTSSGIGRLLKFIEGVVFVYNLQQERIESDINLIHPHAIVVFFKISDLFAALDQLQPGDLQQLRYVSTYLKLERPKETSQLLDRRALME